MFPLSLEPRVIVTPAQQVQAYANHVFRDRLSVDGVFEGGGALGAAYIGALKALWNNHIWFSRVAGNSAGAVTASMIAAGFTAPEIQWLSSGFRNRPNPPDSLRRIGITSPIAFADFLDLPSPNNMSLEKRRRTLSWYALNGTILDVIGDIELPLLPTRDAVTLGIITAITGGQLIGAGSVPLLREIILDQLSWIPDHWFVRNVLPDTSRLRAGLADTLYDASMKFSPLFRMLENMIYEGGLFAGDVFFNTMRRLFGLKIFGDPNARVTFRELKIPLVVIAANLETGEIDIYDGNRPETREMEVVEAVRRSMSIPFVFQPRGHHGEVVDGGVFSNFPVWLLTDAGNDYWPAASIKRDRLKFGFSLDDSKPATWNTRPPKFRVTGNPPHVDTLQVMKFVLTFTVLAEYLRETKGTLSESDRAQLRGNLLENPNDPDTYKLLQTLRLEEIIDNMILLSEASGFATKGPMETDSAIRKVTLSSLLGNCPFIDIEIPVLGFHALDFFVNERSSDLFAIWDRGWHATVGALQEGRHLMPPWMSTVFTQTQSPFV